MTVRRTQTLQISESLNRLQSRSARGQVIGVRLILHHSLSLATRFVQFAAAANSSKENFCVIRGTGRCQTMEPATSTPVSVSEPVSAIVALDVMDAPAGRQVPAAMW